MSGNLPNATHLDDAAHPKIVVSCPEGPSTQYLRTLVPQAIKAMVFGTRVLKDWVLGPFGMLIDSKLFQRGVTNGGP